MNKSEQLTADSRAASFVSGFASDSSRLSAVNTRWERDNAMTKRALTQAGCLLTFLLALVLIGGLLVRMF